MQPILECVDSILRGGLLVLSIPGTSLFWRSEGTFSRRLLVHDGGRSLISNQRHILQLVMIMHE